jgi:hypothetical protein
MARKYRQTSDYRLASLAAGIASTQAFKQGNSVNEKHTVDEPAREVAMLIRSGVYTRVESCIACIVRRAEFKGSRFTVAL